MLLLRVLFLAHCSYAVYFLRWCHLFSFVSTTTYSLLRHQIHNHFLNHRRVFDWLLDIYVWIFHVYLITNIYKTNFHIFFLSLLSILIGDTSINPVIQERKLTLMLDSFHYSILRVQSIFENFPDPWHLSTSFIVLHQEIYFA